MTNDGRVREPLDTTADVETPEHVAFRYQLAGPARRAAAYAIDLLARMLIAGVLAMVLLVGSSLAFDDLAGFGTGALLLILFVVEWGYYVLLETLMGGRSLGKRALNLRVVKQQGVPLGFADSVLRNLLRAADFLPGLYAIGLLVMGKDRYFRRLGDMVAGTLVISEQRSKVEAALKLEPPPSPQELASLPERPQLSNDELDAIELFLRRVGTLNPARELELAELVAPVYAARMRLRYSSAPRFLALLYLRATRRGA